MQCILHLIQNWKSHQIILKSIIFIHGENQEGFEISIGYTPRAKSLGNQARGVLPACTMTTQNSKIRLISSIALKSRLITYLST